MKRSKKYIIGIDEVGRGPLAGPVTVAAVALPQSLIKCKLNSRIFANKDSGKIRDIPLRDSKKLSPKQREVWFRYVKNHPDIFYKISSVSPGVIDRINISKAANLAATSALVRLMTNDKRLTTKKFSVFLDGGLFIKQSLVISRELLVSTITRGDEKIRAIMLASIVAKVTRDRKMKKLHLEYPRYDFINNVGYGTKRHRRAIKKHGLSPIHRRSFTLKKH